MKNSKTYLEQTPFHIASVFDDRNDVLWVWNLLFGGVCDLHAPRTVQSASSPWINNTIRLKINRPFKFFKRAVRRRGPFGKL